jgi:hypothetical protein
MTKIEQLTKEQTNAAASTKEPTNAPASATALVPVGNDALTPGAKFAKDEGVRLGNLMKFVQGEFLSGDEVVPLGTRFACHWTGIERGWIKFGAKGEPPVQHVGLIANGFVMPDRETLGDNDKTKWSIGLAGQLRDPWLTVVYVPMIQVSEGPGEGEVMTFTTTTDTGRRSVVNLYNRCETLRYKYCGQLPVVEIGCKILKNDFNTKVPMFTIVAWQPVGGEGAPLPAMPTVREDLDDEIPFNGGDESKSGRKRGSLVAAS